MARRQLTALLPTSAVPAALALLLLLAPAATAGEATATTQTSEAPPATTTATGTTTVPAPPTPEPPPPTATTPTPSTTTGPEPPPASAPAPQAVKQRSQPPTVTHAREGGVQATGGKSAPAPGQGAPAGGVPSSAAGTPPLPSTLGTSSGLGVPSFFIDSFSIPPFLLPIYQAAGAAYGIPWQILAAINEVETDYGRDLSVSSAGAEGWMQFMPSTWARYGVDVNRSGYEDPYNPADAIFAAARYLAASGGAKDIRAAIFAYNHSQSYVDSVLLRARLLAGTPPALLGAITGLTEAHFPVYAAAHYSDGFPTSEGPAPRAIPGTTIYTTAAAPVIAVQDGRIVHISHGGPFGPSISLRDAYGNTYTYAGLGSIATLYPVLEAPHASGQAALGAVRSFRAGSEQVYLHPLHSGVQVIAGTVLGRAAADAQPRIVFQISPAGAPAIDPKPILDGWVKLQSSSVLRAKGRDPFARIRATPGQALLESKAQLEQQLPRDRSIHLPSCERRLIAAGRADRRVLATLAFLSSSGLHPTVSARSCPVAKPAARGFRAPVAPTVASVAILAVNGLPVGGPGGPTAIATVLVHRLSQLQGVMRPLQIASSTRFAGAPASVALPGYRGVVDVAFEAIGGLQARAAGGFGSGLSPAQWVRLVARLGEVPDPAVSAKPSPAAIPDAATGAASTKTGGR